MLPQFKNEEEIASEVRVYDPKIDKDLQFGISGIYVIDENERVYVSSADSNKKEVTHRSLIRYVQKLTGTKDVQDLKFIGAGSIDTNNDYWNEQQYFTFKAITNKSGTLHPGSKNLERSVEIIQKMFSPKLFKKGISIEDYSLVGKQHPLFVENDFLDPIHTVATVELIGIKSFKEAMRSDDPMGAVQKLMRHARVNGSVRNPRQITKSKNGDYFSNLDEFLAYFSRNISPDHEFDIELTAVEYDGFVGVGNPFGPNGEIYSNTLFHMELMEKPSGEFKKSGKPGRFGIRIRKKSGSSQLEVWEADKSEYRKGIWASSGKRTYDMNRVRPNN